MCWEDELDPREQRLLYTATVLRTDLDPVGRGWGSEFREGGVTLTALDANVTLVRLYLDQSDGRVYTVPVQFDGAEGIRELLTEPVQRREPRTPLTTAADPAVPGAPAAPTPSGPTLSPAQAWSRPAPGSRPTHRPSDQRSTRPVQSGGSGRDRGGNGRRRK